MIFDNQLRYATQIIESYKGEEPLHVWLKDYFRLNKQMGSRDRKTLSALVYGFYRLGHAARSLAIKDRLLAGLLLCNDQPGELLTYFKPAWAEKATAPLPEKLDFFQGQPEGADFRLTDIFPWKDELSPAIDHEALCLSFLRQPDLFLRIRPGYESVVREKLSGIGEFEAPFTIRLPNGFKVEDYFTPDKEVVIQDYSSQRVAGFLQPGAMDHPQPSVQPGKPPHFFWDACAASGGKSILAYDLFPGLDILVSDIRESIIHNLKARFQTAGIKKYHSFLADLSKQTPPASAVNAELILTDVPCTGSGTWGRNPEELYFFEPAAIDRYSSLQKRIMAGIGPHVAPDASLVYCTCSVFKKENEEIVAYIRDTSRLKIQATENLTGYNQRADTLFATRFHR
ncbi:MAG TPA: Fmu (Sun) domain-containing protein [Puia sp.]|nr:Fmu (Sun) domain-containing protein [Puia sp.]